MYKRRGFNKVYNDQIIHGHDTNEHLLNEGDDGSATVH